MTGKKLDYVPVWCGNQLLYAVGFYRGELPFGPFRHDDFKFKMKYVGGGMARICAFARCFQEELDVADSDRQSQVHHMALYEHATYSSSG